MKVFYNSNYGGASQPVAPGADVNLNATLKNQNASHRIGRTYLSVGLYKAHGDRLTCAFDGYSRPEPGRHEGIDFAKGPDVPLYALVGGKVTAVVPGARGSGSARLSTIAIYNSTLNTNPTSFWNPQGYEVR